jgi:hypothetical protein
VYVCWGWCWVVPPQGWVMRQGMCVCVRYTGEPVTQITCMVLAVDIRQALWCQGIQGVSGSVQGKAGGEAVSVTPPPALTISVARRVPHQCN